MYESDTAHGYTPGCGEQSETNGNFVQPLLGSVRFPKFVRRINAVYILLN